MAGTKPTTTDAGLSNSVVPAAHRPFPALVSVVIPARNAAALLPMQLEALSNQTFSGSWEVVIADNGSSDDTTGVALAWRDKLPQLRVVDASTRSGANYARNVGARAAEGQLLLFCDADDEAAPDWLAAMIQTARHFDAVGGPLDNEKLNDPLPRFWNRRTPMNELPGWEGSTLCGGRELWGMG